MFKSKIVTLGIMITCLSCPLASNATVSAQTPTNTSEVLYQQENISDGIFQNDVEEWAMILQEEVARMREANPDITEEELNNFILENFEPNSNISLYSAGYIPYLKDALNAEEQALFNSNPVKGLFAVSCAYTATTWTNDKFDSSCTYLGNGDAYRHSFWQALVAEAYGESYAEQWGNAHESESPYGVDKTMDLSNNRIGRSVGSSSSGYQYVEARISAKLLNMISNGELWRVINGQLTSTDGTGRK